MWIVAGVLLGSVLVSSLLGLHTGPHSHAAAGILGFFAALWLVVMALEGRSSSVLWALLSADVVVSLGVGTVAWKGLTARHLPALTAGSAALTGKEGVAVTALGPEGIVRVRGENWSAISRNGNFAAGNPVQVIGVEGIHLEVWGEQSPESLGQSLWDTEQVGSAQLDEHETRRGSS